MTKKKKLIIGVLAGLSIFTTTTMVLASNGNEGDFNTSQSQTYKQDEQTGRYGSMMEDNQNYGQSHQEGSNQRCHGNGNKRNHHKQTQHHNQTFRRQGHMSQN